MSYELIKVTSEAKNSQDAAAADHAALAGDNEELRRRLAAAGAGADDGPSQREDLLTTKAVPVFHAGGDAGLSSGRRRSRAS